MVLREKDLRLDNISLTEELSRSNEICRKLTDALDLKIKRLYRRNDLLEKMLSEHGIAVPDWADEMETV